MRYKRITKQANKNQMKYAV